MTEPLITLKNVRLSFPSLTRPLAADPDAIRIQFWARYRGYCEVYVKPKPDSTAAQIARTAVYEACMEFAGKWPGMDRHELHCTGLAWRGRILNSKDLPNG